MFIGNVTAGQISSLVWNAAVKTLTSMSGVLTIAHQAQTTVASGAHVDLKSSANFFRTVLFGVTANATFHVDIWDGVNRITGQALSGSASFVDSYASGDGSVGIDLNNTGAAAANYMYVISDWHAT